jgi:hypothetical protein
MYGTSSSIVRESIMTGLAGHLYLVIASESNTMADFAAKLSTS